MFQVFQVTIFQFQGGQAEIGGAAGRFQRRQGFAGQGFQMFGQGRRGPFPQGRQQGLLRDGKLRSLGPGLMQPGVDFPIFRAAEIILRQVGFL